MRRETHGREEEPGTQDWYMVRLDGALGLKGYVAATVLKPVYRTDAQIADVGHTFAAEWAPTSLQIQQVWNGFTPDSTLDSGARCRIDRYFGRWIVTQVEC